MIQASIHVKIDLTHVLDGEKRRWLQNPEGCVPLTILGTPLSQGRKEVPVGLAGLGGKMKREGKASRSVLRASLVAFLCHPVGGSCVSEQRPRMLPHARPVPVSPHQEAFCGLKGQQRQVKEPLGYGDPSPQSPAQDFSVLMRESLFLEYSLT